MGEFDIKINKVSRKLPDLPKKKKKNLFDILGVERRETINSKLVAYFFNAEEDHDFGSLFFDSLMQLIDENNHLKENLEVFKGAFSVLTEEITRDAKLQENKQKRIDVTLKAENWCIIIENKLYHHLNNPLEAYLNHAKKTTENVLGVILSLESQATKEFENGKYKFVSITHQELINRVQQNLILSQVENDSNIFYLREYIRTINSHYKNKMDKPQLDELVGSIIEQKEAVSEIVSKRLRAISFIDETIKEVFAERGYKFENPWFCHPGNNNLCFWITPAAEIIENNNIDIAFEIWNDLLITVGSSTLNAIHSQLNPIASNHFYLDSSLDKPKMKRIITYRENDFLKPGIDIQTKLSGILDEFYFNSGGIENVVLNQLPKTLNIKSASEYLD